MLITVHLSFGGLLIPHKHLILEPPNSKFDLEHQTSLCLARIEEQE